MPAYEYLCPSCGERETIIVSINERDAQICERCETRLIRQPAAPNFTIGGFNAKNGYSK